MSITDLNEHRMRTRGEAMFICCECGAEDGFQVVCLSAGSAPVIVALVCNACSRELPIAHGLVGV